MKTDLTGAQVAPLPFSFGDIFVSVFCMAIFMSHIASMRLPVARCPNTCKCDCFRVTTFFHFYPEDLLFSGDVFSQKAI